MKNPIFRGGVPEKPMYRGELSKKGVGTWTFPDLRRGAWQKRRG